MKKRLSNMVIILWCILLAQKVMTEGEEVSVREQVLETFLEENGGYGKIYMELSSEWKGMKSEESLLEVLYHASEYLGFQSDKEEPLYYSDRNGIKIEKEIRKNGEIWEIQGKSSVYPDTGGRIAFIRITDGSFSDYYFRIELEFTGNAAQADEMCCILEQFQKEYKLDGQVCIRAEIEEKSSAFAQKLQNECREILQKADAEIVKEQQDGNLYMVYAANEHIPQSVKWNGKRINVSLLYRNTGLTVKRFLGIPAVFSDD